MTANAQVLTEKIQALPPERLGEVEDFVDFLAAKTRRLRALDRLLAIAPSLEPTRTERHAVPSPPGRPGNGAGRALRKRCAVGRT